MLIIKRFFSFILAVLLLPSAFACGEDISDTLSARSAVLVWSGEIIYEKNARQKLPMASTTKLMTALLTAEKGRMEEKVRIDAADCQVEGSSMELCAGETFSVKELLKGLLLVSGNDAALALARYVGGSVEAFVKLMNEKASELSMSSTHFTNPHGLSDENHCSTAADLALLMRACLENEELRSIMAMKSCVVGGRTLINHNRLLYKCEGCTGGKTGYTEAAGRCLVSVCQRGGAELICVTLNAPDDWNDHKKLYDKAFEEYSLRNVTNGLRFSVPTAGGAEEYAYLVPQTEKELFCRKRSEVKVTAELPWFLFAPMEKGEIAGKAVITVDGEIIGEYPLMCRDTVSSDNS